MEECSIIRYAANQSLRNPLASARFALVCNFWRRQHYLLNDVDKLLKKMPHSLPDQMFEPRSHRLGFYTARRSLRDNYVMAEVGSYKRFLHLVSTMPNVVVGDLGAHVGVISVELALRGARVIAVEPEYSNFKQLQLHCELNNVSSRVECHRGAIVDCRKNTTALYKSSASYGHTLECVEGRKPVKVPALYAGDILTSQLTALKIDIEGTEYKIQDYIMNCRNLRVVVVELHLESKARRKRAQDFVSFMSDGGFTCLTKPKLGQKHWHTLGLWVRDW